MALTLSLLMAMVLGASAHRAGLCTVRGVAEVLTTRRAHLLGSFLKASIWVTAALALAGLFGAAPEARHWPMGWGALVGGMLFGVGAGLNGGCSFSTLVRLAEGHLTMAATVAGWGLGLMALVSLRNVGLLPPAPTATLASPAPVWLLAPLLPFALWQGLRIRKQLRAAGSLSAALRAPVWTLSFAVALLAVANAGIWLGTGSWSFGSTLMCSTTALPCPANAPLLWPITAAALAGMILSGALRGSLRLRRLRPASALRHGMAGAIMGLGMGLVPGGNDGLILFGLPALSPHALPAWLAMLAGIAASLLAMRALGRPLVKIACEADVCRARL